MSAKQFRTLYYAAVTAIFVISAYSLGTPSGPSHHGVRQGAAREVAISRHPSVAAHVAARAAMRAPSTPKVRSSERLHKSVAPSKHTRMESPAEMAESMAVATVSSEFHVQPAAVAAALPLIHEYFPASAWPAAVKVVWCESRFHVNSINYDSNGTHDRGLFQLNDGGTEQFLLRATGERPANVGLAFDLSWNVHAAAVLYKRDGWSQWSCRSVL